MRFLYTYMGTKSRHLDVLNSLINDSKCANYCEPFLGSGVVFLNLEKNFKNHFLNDLQEENILAFKFSKELTENFIKNVFNHSIEKYPLADKDFYYKFRDELLNSTLNTDPKKAIYIFRIYNTCINGMIRFNKERFNQSYGGDKRLFLSNLSDRLNNYIESIKYINSKNVIIDNSSFEDLLDKKDCLYFLDPPYITNQMGCNSGFNSSSLMKLIYFMLNTKEEFIYTDMINEYNKVLLDKFNWCTLNKIKSVRPKSGVSSSKEEIVVWNFKQKSIFDIV